MNEAEKERLIKKDIKSIENRVRSAFNQGYEMGLKESRSENPNKWIPVSERLPKVGSEVFVCFDFKGKRSVYISSFYGDGEFHGLDDEYLTPEGRKYRKAVAWMPLPDPYKAESEDKI